MIYMIFDLLYLDGESLMATADYRSGAGELEDLELDGDAWRVPPTLDGMGEDVLAASRDRGPRGHRRQADRLALQAGVPWPRVAQDQERAAPGVRDRRLHRRAGAPCEDSIGALLVGY